MHLMTYVACKNAKFTMTLSTTHHTMLGRCVESRQSNTCTCTYRDFKLKLIYKVECLQANRLYSPHLYVHVHE